VGVEGAPQHVEGQGRFAAEVDDLADGVDAGVGAAAGVDAQALAGEALNGFLQHLLHGAQPRLHLPAVEVGAVVAQRQSEVPHVRPQATARIIASPLGCGGPSRARSAAE
jgi:hypothetical protein